MFIFALISATLFACTPIENEPNIDIIDTVDTDTTPVITPDTVWQGYDYGFYYGKTYDVTIYQDGEAPEQESIVFVNDSLAIGDGADFTSYWSIDGVELVVQNEVWAEHFVFYYFNETDRLVCQKTPELTIVISKP